MLDCCSEKSGAKSPPYPAENYIKTLSDVDFINFIEVDFTEISENLLEKSKLNSMYIVILTENGVQTLNAYLASNYKKYIKELLEENIPNVVFVKGTQKNKPEKLISTLTQQEAI